MEVYRNPVDTFVAGFLVSPPMTGEAVELGNFKEAKKAIPDTPVLANTGVNIENVDKILAPADGAIIGTAR